MPARPDEQHFEVRDFRDDDEPGVLALLAEAFPEWPPAHSGVPASEFFRWKHLSGPSGRSSMQLAEADGRIIAFRGSMPWRVCAGDRVIEGCQAVDLCTHPSHRRRHIYTAVVDYGFGMDRERRQILLSAPNEQSAASARKYGGHEVGKLALRLRIRRPLRAARLFRARHQPIASGWQAPEVDAPPATEGLRDSPSLAGLLAERERPGECWETVRDLPYLRWRYGPPLDYRIVIDEAGGDLRGLAVFRVRPRGPMWEAGVTELLVRPGDRSTARRLLRRVAAAAPVDELAASFRSGSAAASGARSAGFVFGWTGTLISVNPIQEGMRPDPTRIDSWAFTLGDFEELF